MGEGTDWRIHATYDLSRGGYSHLALTDGTGAEAVGRAGCDDGGVRRRGVMIADRGYAKAGEMAAFRTGSGGRPRDFIVHIRLKTLDSTPFKLTSTLHQMAQDPGPDPLNQPRECTVQALYGRDKKTSLNLPEFIPVLLGMQARRVVPYSALEKLRRSQAKYHIPRLHHRRPAAMDRRCAGRRSRIADSDSWQVLIRQRKRLRLKPCAEMRRRLARPKAFNLATKRIPAPEIPKLGRS